MFCKKCGQRLGAEASSGATGRRLASPDSYTPRHLAEKILTSKTALEGERNQVTVLYFGLFSLGLAHLRRGDLPRATRVLERCDDLCRSWQFVVAIPAAEVRELG